MAAKAGLSVVFVLAGIGVVLLDYRPGAAMVAGGLVVMFAGSLRLASFLRSHPAQGLESNGV